MAIKARQKSTTGMYHVLIRAAAGITLIHDDEDRAVYTQAIKLLEEKGYCTIHAYSLHENHVHILLKENNENIAQVMKRLGATYSYYYNVKYDHYGPIYLDRFKSEPVDTEIFFNRVKDFIEGRESQCTLPVLDIKERPQRVTDIHLEKYLRDTLGITDIRAFRQTPIESQLNVIRSAKAIGGSVRQLFRLTGVPYNVIAAAK